MRSAWWWWCARSLPGSRLLGVPAGRAAAALAAMRASCSCANCSLRSSRYVGTCGQTDVALDADRTYPGSMKARARVQTRIKGLLPSKHSMHGRKLHAGQRPSKRVSTYTHTHVWTQRPLKHTHTHTCPKSDLCRYSPAPAPALASALTGLRAAAAAAASLFSSTKSLAVLRSPAEPSELLLLGCWCCCLPPEAPAPAVAGQEATQAWRDVRMCECARHTVLAGRRRAARNGRPHPVCSHLHAGCLLLTVCAGRLLLLRCARPAAVLSAVR